MAVQPNAQQDLWQRAIDSLPPSTIKSLEPARTGKRDVALATLKAAEEKRELALKKRWRIKVSGQDEIIVRDVVEKIIDWIRRFIKVGDQIVQYDPVHAALPWAAFRFLLQAAINDNIVYSGLVDDLEMVARLMARFHEMERLYILGSAAVDETLCNALVKVYGTILLFLAKAMDFMAESTAARLLKAPFRSIDDDCKEEILSDEAEILKVAALIDAERVKSIENQVIRLADRSVAAQKAVEEQQFLDVLRWLSQVAYSRHHEHLRVTRVPGTGQWLAHHPEVRSWASASSCSLFLLHGIVGCGKTSLCSVIIDNYQDEMAKTPNAAPLAYFYCSVTESEPERRSPEGVLRSLARQLTVSRVPLPTIHNATLALFSSLSDEAKADGFEMRRATVPQSLDLILAALDDNPATIVIDALDEVEEPKRLAEALNTIITKSKNVVKILVTCRDNPAIFSMLPFAQMMRITHNENKADIRLYAKHAVAAAISEHKLLMGNVTKSSEQQVIEALESGAQEMFLWVKLQLLHLCSMEHEGDLITAATSLEPATLNELYDTAYQRIQQAGNTAREIATQSFIWLLWAKEPLTVDALLSAVSSSTKLEEVTLDNILFICRGFVYFDKQLMVLRLAHHSVREFLQLQQTLRADNAHGLLALNCLSIFFEPPDDPLIAIEPSKKVYDYAVLYCGYHFSAAQAYGMSNDVYQALTVFFFEETELSLAAKIWMDNCRVAYRSLPREHPQLAAMELVTSEQGSPLIPISTFGLLDVLKRAIWPPEFDWNEKNDHGQTALYAASFFGYTEVVAFLLDHGSSSNIECGRYGSALRCAAHRGHVEVVKLLLAHDADDADAKLGGKFDSAIHVACRGNQEAVVLAILEQAKMVDQDQYDSVLEAVSEAGFSLAIKKLHDHPLSKSTKPSKMQQVASKVITSGKIANLKYLTREHALVDTVPPASVALSALHGHEAMTTYLLDQGLSIMEDGDLGSPLRCASISGSSSVCQLLLSRGADVNGNGRFGSALHAASMKGQLHIAKLLLDAAADVNIRGGFYGTSLQAAAYQGHTEIVELLLKSGADPFQSGFSNDAFRAAEEGGQYDIVWLMSALGFIRSEPISSSPPMCLVAEKRRSGQRESAMARIKTKVMRRIRSTLLHTRSPS